MKNVWSELARFGVNKDQIFPDIQKTFEPSPNLPKSQFREHVLKACRRISQKPLDGAEAIEISLIADEIWDRWPRLDA